MNHNATAKLAEFSADLTYADIPAPMREIGKWLLIDSLGAAIGGHVVSKGTIPRDLALKMGGSEDASIIGHSGRVPIPLACLANGELINALDYDAILAPGHVVPYVMPPALAFAELANASGEALITAVVLAHEIGCRVAAALDGIRRRDGVQGVGSAQLSPASGYGSTIFGAVAGAGNVLGFDGPQMANLFGIAGYAAPVPGLAKFLTAKHSFHAKYTSAGQLAMAAATSTLLAQAGYHGDETILDGEFGFWRMFASSTCDWDFMLGGLGTEWRLARNEFKPFPAFRMSHDAITAVRAIIGEHAIDPAKITAIRTTADPICLSECYLSTSLTDHTDAQLSWRRLLATSAFYEPGPEWQLAALTDERVLRLSERITVSPATDAAAPRQDTNSDVAFEKAFPTWLKSSLEIDADGQTYRAAAPTVTKGHPDNAMTTQELESKFLINAEAVIGATRAKAALASLLNMENLQASEIMAATRPG